MLKFYVILSQWLHEDAGVPPLWKAFITPVI